jgi:hypothetical protein
MSLPLLIAVLLVVAAALFGVGVAMEHSGGDTHAAVATTGSAGHTETGQEGSESGTAPAGHSETATSERVLGIALESPATVTAAVVVSLLLAGLVWRYPRRPVLIVVALFAAGAAVFDVAEVARQVSADRAGVAALAVVVAVLHVAVVVVAATVLLRPAGRVSRV